MNTSLSQKSLCTNGFTLIEMVVVITILILLTTAAFVSYSDYSSSARDSNRVSDLSGFYGALETYKAKVGELPDPSSGVSVLSGSTTELAKQGYLGADILAKIGVDRGGEDPRSGLYYTYLVNSNKDKAQLLGFFEGAGFENKLAFGVVPQAYALSDNSTLFPATTGKKLGVFLLSATKSPIQEAFSGSVTLASLVSSGTIISGSCLSLSGSTTSSTMTGTLTLTGGTNLASCYVNSSSTPSTSSNRYPGCDMDDITLTNGQVWAACNVGSSTSGITSASYGSYFQWWRNISFSNAGSVSTTAWPLSAVAAAGTSNFITNSTSPSDWITPSDGNLWWGSSTTGSSGTYATVSGWDKSLMQWPCATGYHVPTIKEWADANASSTIRTALNIGIITYRFSTSSLNPYSSTSDYNYYWSSTPSWNSSYAIHLYNPSLVVLTDTLPRGYALPVRCLKN